MTAQPAIHLLLAAAGSGTRCGLAEPKQFHKISGKSIYLHTLEKLCSCVNFNQIRVICPEEQCKSGQEALAGYDSALAITGGKSRKESVLKGLNAFSNIIDEDIIVIHDAVRPFIARDDLEAAIAAARETGAASFAHPVSDTLCRENGEAVAREGLYQIQSPQIFRYGLIREAHEKAAGMDTGQFTDDAALVRAAGHPVQLVMTRRSNIKITWPEDIALAEKLLAAPRRTVIGNGFDVHAFGAGPGPVRLGGIDIPHDHELEGHSDADAVLHAVTDALLGTLGDGADIGHHFPSSEAQWKGAASPVFLEKAQALVTARGGRIDHLDITIIGEAPKIGPHRDAMRISIAGLLDLSDRQVAIKATTTQTLGFLGRRQGLAVQVLATLSYPATDTEAA